MQARVARRVNARRLAATLIVTVAVMAAGLTAAGSGEYEEAVALYRAARFDEALLVLDRLEGAVASGDRAAPLGAAEKESASEMRALCLIALDRDADARAVVQGILRQRISYEPRASDVPPRFAAMVRDSRADVWRALVRDEYRAGKAAYEQKAFRSVAEHLGRVGDLMREPRIDALARASLADLGDLAREYLTLAAAADPVPTLAPPPGPAPSPPPTDRIYTALDEEVLPPVALNQQLPGWRSGGAEQQILRGRKGQVEIVIDTQGRVEAARMLASVHPLYDGRLIASTGYWHYRPAQKDGASVRFRKVIQVQLVDQP
jgi:hypothetical protein